MKIADNRALVAKKKHYNHPAVHVAHLASMTLMQAASPAGPASGGGQLNPGIPTDDQW